MSVMVSGEVGINAPDYYGVTIKKEIRPFMGGRPQVSLLYIHSTRLIHRLQDFFIKMEPSKGFEPLTSSLPWMRSTPELRWRIGVIIPDGAYGY